MARLKGNIPIILIQGQTYKIRRKINKNAEYISSIVISCNELELEEQMELVGDEYVCVLSDSVTSEFEVTETTYDMTITYTDGTVDIETGIPFIVRERQNPLGA